MRKTGVEVIGEVPSGTYFCQFFPERQDVTDIMIPYLARGIGDNEYCMLVASPPLESQTVINGIAQILPDVKERVARGQIEILDYRQWHLALGKFDVQRVLFAVEAKAKEAVRNGFDGMRIADCVAWPDKSDWPSFVAYMNGMSTRVRDLKIVALSSFWLENCPLPHVFDAASRHEFSLVKAGAQWQIISRASFAPSTNGKDSYGFTGDVDRSPELLAHEIVRESIHRLNAQAEFRKYRSYMEDLVQRRTEELRRMNEQLRREAEEREKIAIDLRRSNQELEQFAYVTSHDLREPLRVMSAFVQRLADRYDGQLDEKAHQYIGFVVESVTRMQCLIDDVLEFSRIGVNGRNNDRIECNEVVDAAMQNCALSIEASHAKVTRGELPTLQGDGRQLTQLFQNLISNGIKFAREGVPPTVRIDAQRTPSLAAVEGTHDPAPSTVLDSLWLFSVQDNGIGIAPEHAERIFKMFQRLHERTAYEGTGMGLAICKKIVHLHGGKIWVESMPGEGSKFLFTLAGLEAP